MKADKTLQPNTMLKKTKVWIKTKDWQDCQTSREAEGNEMETKIDRTYMHSGREFRYTRKESMTENQKIPIEECNQMPQRWHQ